MPITDLAYFPFFCPLYHCLAYYGLNSFTMYSKNINALTDI